jgi:hypothetical protein
MKVGRGTAAPNGSTRVFSTLLYTMKMFERGFVGSDKLSGGDRFD